MKPSSTRRAPAPRSRTCSRRSGMSSRIRPRPRSTGWSATSGSTGSGCRRGDRTRSPRTAASSCARSASTSDPAVPRAGAMTRRVEVAPQRFAGWVASFADRHGGGLTADQGSETVSFGAADGAVARCQVPFPPLACAGAVSAADARRLADAGPAGLAQRIAEHACADRTVGVLLVRRGGYAAGVFTGTGPSLAASKVGSRLVQGRSAAGGQSQRRFARRRENQAQQALAAAASTAAAVFAPYRLDALVLGGDRRALAVVSTDVRLVPYFERAVEAFLAVPDPRLAVLRDTPRLFRAIRITLTEPAPDRGQHARRGVDRPHAADGGHVLQRIAVENEDVGPRCDLPCTVSALPPLASHRGEP